MGNPILNLFDDPKQLELVKTITEKTLQQKLRWNKTPTTYESSLPGGGRLTFALSTPPLPFLNYKTWSHFVVRHVDGNEVLKVQHTSALPFFGLQEASKTRLEVAVEKLFDMVNNTAKDEVDKVIDQLKNL